MLNKAMNVARAALNPGNALVMAKKVVKRLVDRTDRTSMEKNLAWIHANCQDFGVYASAANPELWEEAQAYGRELRARAAEILSAAGVSMGGGGFYPMLYFLARQRRPEVIVETGVAAGYSSQVFLKALALNGRGSLYSSDFPYFRMKDPEKYIGILVEKQFKPNWHLYVKGDDANLPQILESIHQVDLFHYDSDKTYSGRALAMSKVVPKMARSGLIVMDDIQDNTFFKEYVEQHADRLFSVFEFEGKFIGFAEV